LGPGQWTATAQGMAPTRTQGGPTLAMPAVQAIRSLDNNAVYYRLLYRDALQPKPYAQARWSIAPPELLDQQLRDLLGASWTVIHPQDNLHVQPGIPILHLYLDEFSHIFSTPDKSDGLLKIRATLSAANHKGARLIAQRNFTITHPSTSLDAAGGVQALRQTVNTLAQQLDQWLHQHAPTTPP
jgi:cholesterol transport system auxiliary component